MKLVPTTVLACLLLLMMGSASHARTVALGRPIRTASGKALVILDLIDFDPAIGDVHGRLHLRLPPEMLSKDQSPTRDLTLVDADTVDESVLRIPREDAIFVLQRIPDRALSGRRSGRAVHVSL